MCRLKGERKEKRKENTKRENGETLSILGSGFKGRLYRFFEGEKKKGEF